MPEHMTHYSPSAATLTVVTRHEGREHVARMRWADDATAGPHIEGAIDELIAEGDRFTQAPPNENETIRLRRTHFGTYGAMTMSGPPTWWLPRPRVLLGRRPRSIELRFGWLRWACQLWFSTSHKPWRAPSASTKGDEA